MYRKFSLFSPSNADDLAPIKLEPSDSIPHLHVPALTLTLAQLHNCGINLAAGSKTLPDAEKLRDIYRQTNLNIFGCEDFSQSEDRIPEIIAVLNHAKTITPINQLFLDFINLGLFSQAIWLFACKATFEKILGEKYIYSATGSMSANDSGIESEEHDGQQVDSILSICNTTPNNIEVCYVNALHGMDITQFPIRNTFSGLFVQKIIFSMNYSSAPIKWMNHIDLSQLTQHLYSQVSEANFYLTGGQLPANFHFTELPLLYSDRISYRHLLPSTPTPYGSPQASGRNTPHNGTAKQSQPCQPIFGTPISTPFYSNLGSLESLSSLGDSAIQSGGSSISIASNSPHTSRSINPNHSRSNSFSSFEDLGVQSRLPSMSASLNSAHATRNIGLNRPRSKSFSLFKDLEIKK